METVSEHITIHPVKIFGNLPDFFYLFASKKNIDKICLFTLEKGKDPEKSVKKFITDNMDLFKNTKTYAFLFKTSYEEVFIAHFSFNDKGSLYTLGLHCFDIANRFGSIGYCINVMIPN